MEKEELISKLVEKCNALDSEDFVYIKLSTSESNEERVYNIQSITKRKSEISVKINREIQTSIKIKDLLDKIQNWSEGDNLVYWIDKLHSQGLQSFEITSFEVIDGDFYLISYLFPEFSN